LYHKNNSNRVKEKEIEQAVISCFHKHNGNYGRPRIKRALEKEGIVISESKIARIMKENGLIAKAGRRRKRRKPKKTEEEILRENLLLNKDLSKLKRNEVWSSDITEIKINGRILYVAGVIDVASRVVLGIYVATHMRQEIVHQAIKMAANKVEDTTGIIFHTDRGSQYTAKKTQQLLEELDMIPSMSRPGKPNDNQTVESLWNSLKTELGSLTKLTKNVAIKKIYNHVTNYYNDVRMHSGIGYRTPMEAYNELSEHNCFTSLDEIIHKSKCPIKDATHS
jgi:transposase InsO family protein